MQAHHAAADSSTPNSLRCIEAVFRELRQQCAQLRSLATGLICQTGSARAEQDLQQSYRQFLILERRSWRPLATFSLRESWCSGAVESDIESEFDLRELLGPARRYLQLEGFGFVPGLDVSTVLEMALQQIGQLYVPTSLAGISGRVSLPLGGGDKYVQALMYTLRDAHHCTRQAMARVALREGEPVVSDDVILPRSLHAWLKQGACVGSEPYWDAEQGQARLLLWLSAEQLLRTDQGANNHAMAVACQLDSLSAGV